MNLFKMMSRVCWLIILSIVVIFCAGQTIAARKNRKLLVVTVTKGFRHESIPTAERVLQQLGEQSKPAFTLDFARTDEELKAKTTLAALATYDGIIFANTTGDLPLADREAFLNWIKAGHAFIGFHAATDTFPGFPDYIEMIGGQFSNHGPQVKVQCLVEDTKHPATKTLEKSFAVFDEIYVLKNFNRSNVHMLLSLDKHPNTGVPGYYPLAWSRMYGRGRVFYTALGHREDVLEADWFKRHLLGGIRWALGEEKGSAKPQTKSQTK